MGREQSSRAQVTSCNYFALKTTASMHGLVVKQVHTYYSENSPGSEKPGEHEEVQIFPWM